MNGILLTAGTTVTVSNNLVGNLTAPLANISDAIRGISITSATASTTYKVYYNTVYINATSTGATFGTSGLFHPGNATSTTAQLDLRNNIIVNTSTPNGAVGYTVAFRKSLANLSNYAATSNNNDFYAGTPGVNNFIYYDGTNSQQTLAGYKAMSVQLLFLQETRRLFLRTPLL